jgi:SAM-dependent methyltransferase
VTYRPDEYWEDRLRKHPDLRGTGHVSYSESYNAWLYRGKRRALHKALRHLPARSRVLDVGSGVGWVVDQLRQAGHRADGCDIAPTAVAALTQRFPDATFFLATIGGDPLPVEDASYDAVTFLDVAYHIVDEAAWERAVADVARVLRPGGHLVVIDQLGAEDQAPAAHVRFRSRDHWARVSSAHGLSVVEVLPTYRYLSRPRHPSRLSRLPDSARGAVEYVLDAVSHTEPRMRCAVFRKA